MWRSGSRVNRSGGVVGSIGEGEQVVEMGGGIGELVMSGNSGRNGRR